MNKRLLSALLSVLALAAAAAIAAQTLQPHQMQVKVDFTNPVIVGDKTLGPGNYRFEEVRGQNNPTVFKIYKENTDKPAFTAIASQTAIDTRVDPGTPERTRFVLLQVGDNYYLSKLWLGGQGQGWDFLRGTSMAEKAGKEVNIEANEGNNQSSQPTSVGKPQ